MKIAFFVFPKANKKPLRKEGACWWSHLSLNQGYISTDYQIVRCLRWFDNRTNLVRSSNHVKNQRFLNLNQGPVQVLLELIFCIFYFDEMDNLKKYFKSISTVSFKKYNSW